MKLALIYLYLLSVSSIFTQSVDPTTAQAVAISPFQINIYLSNVSKDAAGFELQIDQGELIKLPVTERIYTLKSLLPNSKHEIIVRTLYTGGRAICVMLKETTYRDLPAYQKTPLLIIGARASGVGAAISAARMGRKVILTEETNRPGGMITNGVSATDVQGDNRLNGLFEEFRSKVTPSMDKGLHYEPSAALRTIKSMLEAEPNISIFYGIRPIAVKMKGSKIRSVLFESLETGKVCDIEAEYFIDTTETADAAVWAGAKYRVGREPRSVEEPHAGVIYYVWATDTFLPGSTGAGDKRVQAYAYMLCVKDYRAGVDKTIQKPEGYDPTQYIHAVDWEDSWAKNSGYMPNGKYEINDHPQGSDLIGQNYDYPNGDYKARDAIAKKHREHALGFLYYLQTVRGMKSLGLAEDEYPDTNNISPLMYIREARRIIGYANMTESDVSMARERPQFDSISIGDYPLDSHATQPKTDWTSPDKGEGAFWLRKLTPWFQAPYGIIVPKGVDNLFVTTAVSATHVAFGSLRLEPIRMTLGQAAAAACELSMLFDDAPLKIPSRLVQEKILNQGVYISWFADLTADNSYFHAYQYLAVRGYFKVKLARTAAAITQSELAELLSMRLHDERWAEQIVKGELVRDANEFVSRGEFALKLIAIMKTLEPGWDNSKEGVNSQYVDVPANSPFYEAVNILRYHHIHSGIWDGIKAFEASGQLFQPEKPITRGEAAEALYLTLRYTVPYH